MRLWVGNRNRWLASNSCFNRTWQQTTHSWQQCWNQMPTLYQNLSQILFLLPQRQKWSVIDQNWTNSLDCNKLACFRAFFPPLLGRQSTDNLSWGDFGAWCPLVSRHPFCPYAPPQRLVHRIPRSCWSSELAKDREWRCKSSRRQAQRRNAASVAQRSRRYGEATADNQVLLVSVSARNRDAPVSLSAWAKSHWIGKVSVRRVYFSDDCRLKVRITYNTQSAVPPQATGELQELPWAAWPLWLQQLISRCRWGLP